MTALVLAPENSLLDEFLSEERHLEVLEYRKTTMAKTAVQRQQDAKEKTGVESGLFAVHPLTEEKIPIRYADYVLADYGSGSVMMVPAHDQRDWEFAKKFEIEIRQVVAPTYRNGGNCSPKDDVDTIQRRVVDSIIENDQ